MKRLIGEEMTTVKTYLKNWKLEADGQFCTDLADERGVGIFKMEAKKQGDACYRTQEIFWNNRQQLSLKIQFG